MPTATAHPDLALAEEHTVLLWQTCAYADELVERAQSPHPLTKAVDRMLGFLHYRLLPYLRDEERDLPHGELRDDHLARVLLTDHDRIRAEVENVESARTRALVAMSTGSLVTRLDRHVQREETWVTDTHSHRPSVDTGGWVAPLVLGDDIDLDVLPAEGRELLVVARLRQLRAGESVRVAAAHDLHPVWTRLRTVMPGRHSWVYEQDGPAEWVARVTRR
jgi:uncharacterized protein (DUF2249 family)